MPMHDRQKTRTLSYLQRENSLTNFCLSAIFCWACLCCRWPLHVWKHMCCVWTPLAFINSVRDALRLAFCCQALSTACLCFEDCHSPKKVVSDTAHHSLMLRPRMHRFSSRPEMYSSVVSARCWFYRGACDNTGCSSYLYCTGTHAKAAFLGFGFGFSVSLLQERITAFGEQYTVKRIRSHSATSCSYLKGIEPRSVPVESLEPVSPEHQCQSA